MRLGTTDIELTRQQLLLSAAIGFDGVIFVIQWLLTTGISVTVFSKSWSISK